jgi:hypothetical protein
MLSATAGGVVEQKRILVNVTASQQTGQLTGGKNLKC